MRKARSLIVGVVCGIVCVLGLLSYTNEVQSAAAAERAEALSRYGTTQVEVYVATRDISPGSKADSTNSERRTMPSELLPEGSVTDLSQIEGGSAQSEVYKGEVLVAKRFEESEGTSISVPDGMCAVSVPAKAVSAIGGSVAPGDEVNVYSTTASSTDLLAANVSVLSTSVSASASSKKETASSVSWITLAVKPSLVSELIAAAGSSELYFTLPSEKLTESDIRQAQKAWEQKSSDASDVSGKEQSSDGESESGSATSGFSGGVSLAAADKEGK